MRETLKPAGDSLAEAIRPYLDEGALTKAGLTADCVAAAALKAAVAALSKDFVVTPRRHLTALLNESMEQASPEAIQTRIAVLQIALAAARLR